MIVEHDMEMILTCMCIHIMYMDEASSTDLALSNICSASCFVLQNNIQMEAHFAVPWKQPLHLAINTVRGLAGIGLPLLTLLLTDHMLSPVHCLLC